LTKKGNDLFTKLSIIQILSLNKDGLEIGQLADLVGTKVNELKKILKSMIMIGVYPYDPMSYLEIVISNNKAKLILSQDIHKYNNINFQEGEILRNLILSSDNTKEPNRQSVLLKLNTFLRYNIDETSESKLLIIQKAIDENSQISIQFKQSNQLRIIDPWFVIKKGEGYLVGYCHQRHDERIFRFDKINQIKQLTSNIQNPCPSEKKRFEWDQSNGLICKIAFHPNEKETIQSIFHPNEISNFKDWLSCNIIIYSIENLFTILKRLGSQIVLLSPGDLKNEFYSQIKHHHLSS
jgi:hypothetical protein